MKRIFCLAALLVVFAAAASADVRFESPTPKGGKTPKAEKTPKQPRSLDSKLYIRLDREATEARLIIPKSELKQLRAELEELDDETDSRAASAFSGVRTVAAGLFLSLAFVFGGVWFVRSRHTGAKTNKTVIAGAVLLFSGAFAVIGYANVGPPPEARSITGKLFSEAVHQYNFASGEIKIEVGDEEGLIQLIVPDGK